MYLKRNLRTILTKKRLAPATLDMSMQEACYHFSEINNFRINSHKAGCKNKIESFFSYQCVFKGLIPKVELIETVDSNLRFNGEELLIAISSSSGDVSEDPD